MWSLWMLETLLRSFVKASTTFNYFCLLIRLHFHEWIIYLISSGCVFIFSLKMLEFSLVFFVVVVFVRFISLFWSLSWEFFLSSFASWLLVWNLIFSRNKLCWFSCYLGFSTSMFPVEMKVNLVSYYLTEGVYEL